MVSVKELILKLEGFRATPELAPLNSVRAVLDDCLNVMRAVEDSPWIKRNITVRIALAYYADSHKWKEEVGHASFVFTHSPRLEVPPGFHPSAPWLVALNALTALNDNQEPTE